MRNTMKKRITFFRRAVLTLLLAVAGSSPTWAQQLSGSGTAEDPYLIQSDADWITFCNKEVANESHPENVEHFRLTADITATKYRSKSFAGEFDGNGHTITINHNYNRDSWPGLFRAGGTSFYIHDLKLQGIVYPGYANGSLSYGGALVGWTNGSGTKVIENCVVSADLRVRNNHTDGYIGGIIGQDTQWEFYYGDEVYNEGVTLRNCVFNGSTPRTGGRFDAGIVGYSNNTSNYSALHLENCVYAPKEAIMNPEYTISPQYKTAEGLYYTSPATNVQGTQVYDILQAGDVYTLIAIPFKNSFNYYYQPQSTVSISGLQDSYPYTGSPIAISYTVINDGVTLSAGDYTAVIKNANDETVTTVTAAGDYQLRVTIGDVTYVSAFYVSGPLTQVDGVYQINSLSDWMTFADDVAEGTSYSGATLHLNTNLTTEVMIGTAEHKFSGTFDGDGHTITFNKTASEDYCAPFRYIEDATISNLTVKGTVTTTGIKLGGLVAYACGTNTISHCTVSAILTCNRTGNTDASNGGFIAHVQNDGGSTTMTYCTFNGFLYGTKAHCNGGFVGWGGTTINLDHCLFNPVEVTMGSIQSSTFARCETVNYNHVYYLGTFGETQGILAYTSVQSSLCDKQTMGDGNDYYILRSSSIENLARTFEYADGNNVSLSAYYVMYDGATLDPSKYTVTIRNSRNTVVSAPTEVGRYKMTVSGRGSEGYDGSISQDFWVFKTLPTDADGFSLVGDMTDWISLAYLIESSQDIAGLKIKLTADIGTEEAPITKMVGEVYLFNGIFDGDGHTLTIDLEERDGAIAPFRNVGNATFVNTHVVGKAHGTAYRRHSGGLVGVAWGIVNITACRSSVEMWGWQASDAGGFVVDHDRRSKITITDCLFDGIIRAPLGSGSGFMGSLFYDNSLTLINCLNNGTIVNDGSRIISVYPIAANLHNLGHTFSSTNCWHKFATSPAPTLCDDFYEQGDGYTALTGSDLRDRMGSGWTINANGEVVPGMVTTYSRSITVADDIIHGTVTAPASCVYGQPVTLTVTPDENYSIVNVTYNDGTVHNVDINNGVYSFTMPNANVTVSATFGIDPDAIPYMAYNTTTGKMEQRLHTSPTAVTAAATTLGTAGGESWYIVNNDVTVTGRMTAHGTVHLILADCKTLTAEAGITVHEGNTLNIYGQADGTGAIVATVVDAGGNYAAIGTEDNSGDPEAHTLDPKVLGTVNIHGGHITATGGAWSAGIGGGVGGGGGTINIYGGTISSTATHPGYGIQQAVGCGSSGAAVTRSIVDGLRVYCNNNSTPTSYNDRIGGLGQQIAVVEPCVEHNFVNNVCSYCGRYNHYELSYNANGATSGYAPQTDIIPSDGDRIATVSDNTDEMERIGYTFAGWNTEADGSGTAFEPGDEFTIGEMVTLYAQWEANTYVIEYNLDGGTTATLNPVIYTIESGAITLVNPTKTDCYFMGWSGTGIDGTSTSVTIPAGSFGQRSYTAVWDNNEPPFAGMEIDHYYPVGQVERYYVKMPYPGEEDYDYDNDIYYIVGAEETPRIVNIPEGFTTPFKVYDDGGKDQSYTYNPSESHLTTLILNAPEGKVFRVSGIIEVESYENWLKIYDDTTADNEIDVQHVIDEWGYEEGTVVPFVTTGNSIRFDLFAEDDLTRNGMDLTVTVTTPPLNITLANDDSQLEQKNTGLIASNNGTFANVTLDGRTLYKDGHWNTLCLPFDIDDISVTPLNGATLKTLSSATFNDETSQLAISSTDASSIEAGKPYLVKWEIAHKCTAGGDNAADLIDGHKEYDWDFYNKPTNFCEFEVSGTWEVTGYTLTTGSEVIYTNTYYHTTYNRNPRAWELYGKLNESDEWTLIDSRDATTTPADALPTTDMTDKYYTAANPGTYRYFRFDITISMDGDERTKLGELTIDGNYTVGPADRIETPTFNHVTIKNEQHPMTSNGVTFAGNYSSLATTTGLMLDEHNLFGDALHASLSVTDPDNIPDGYSFGGWYVDAEKTISAASIPFDADTGNVTLYAKLIPSTYTVVCNSNGGTGTMSPQRFTYGTEQSLALNAFSREGYTFVGWSRGSDGSVDFVDGQSVQNLTAEDGATVTLYAKWKRTVTITANSDTKVYDGTALTVGGYTATGLYDGDVLTATVTITGSQTNVGTSDNVITDVESVVIMRGEENVTADYAIATENGTLTVNPKVVDNPTIILSQTEYTYDGTAHTPDVTVKDDETVISSIEYSVAYSDNTEVGTATVTISDNEDGNYIVSGSTNFIVNATINRNIAAGTWQAISTPMHDNGKSYESIANVDGLTDASYDLLRYNESSATWENQKHSEVSGQQSAGFDVMEIGRGYIYRCSETRTLTFKGMPNDEATYSVTLTASGSSDLRGFNLVGNPYPYRVLVDRAFYSLGADGTWTAHPYGDSIDVGQGVLVHTATGETLTFYAATRSTNPGSKGYLPPLPSQFGGLSSESGVSGCGSINSEIRVPNSELTTPFAYCDGNRLVITLPGHLEVYDALGRRLLRFEILNSHFSILNSQFPGTGVYILRLNEKIQKIVIKK